VISAIGGTAGVGKTALAMHWAHQVAARFPDGQLYVNLRGYDPGPPVPAADALAGFLRSLGVPGRDIPPETDERAARYRSLLAERKMLVVLDNARDEGQVRPLLPASPASLVLITSRNQLAGLAAADGARLLSLDVLTQDEAVQLLTARIGASRAATEPGAISEIATLCAHLPLALAVAAARAAARPRFPLTELAAELRGTANRLDALDAGDPAVSVAAVFSWSYQQLSPDAGRMFRLLGLHPGPDISVRAAASLAAVDESQAGRLLRELARGCLITEHAPGRYASHDLLRAYAASQARGGDSQSGRDAAISRILDHYLHTAGRAALLLRPSDAPLALAAPGPGARPEQPGDHRQALAWFEAEHQVLLAAVAFAAETGADSHAWQLPWAMKEYLLKRGYPHERVIIFGSALAAAERLDDTPGQAMALRALGNACTDTGKYDQARAYHERCILLYQQLGDHRGEAWAQHNLSTLAEVQGHYAEALDHNEQALRLLQAIGHELGEAEILGNIGWFHALLGDYHRARAFCEESLALIAKLGDCEFAYFVWDTLGYIELHLDDFARAVTHFEHALGLCRDYGDRATEGEILTHLGDAHHAAGELPQAREAWQQALATYDDIHHPGSEQVRAKLASCEALAQ
jgi:tetratricopeptide (TPR) repeat protein